MTTAPGVGMYCEATDYYRVGVDTPCLLCDRRFVLGAADIAVRADGERIGSVCPDCLDPEGRARYHAACARYMRECDA